MRPGGAVRGSTFLGKDILFTCVSPQRRVSFGHWRLQATTAHLGTLLRTQDEKRHSAIWLILAFHRGISEDLNVLFLGISFLLNVIYQISTVSECDRTVHYGLRFQESDWTIDLFSCYFDGNAIQTGLQVHHTTMLVGVLLALCLILKCIVFRILHLCYMRYFGVL